RRGKRTVLPRQHHDAVRRRQEDDGRDHQGAIVSPLSPERGRGQGEGAAPSKQDCPPFAESGHSVFSDRPFCFAAWKDSPTSVTALPKTATHHTNIMRNVANPSTGLRNSGPRSIEIRTNTNLTGRLTASTANMSTVRHGSLSCRDR